MYRNWKTVDLFPILFKDLKMIKHQIWVNFDLEISKKQNQMNKSVQEINDDFKTWKKILDISEFGSLKHLKRKKHQIKAEFFLNISQIWEQVSKSVKEINSCIKILEKNLSISKIDLLKLLYRVKNLKFVDFEENKCFYRVLKEEDGIYKGIVGIGQEDGFMKEGKGNKWYKDGKFFEGEWKTIKEKEKEFLNLQMEMFMKAILKMVKGKEKEFWNLQMEMFMKEIEKMIKEKEKE